MPGDGGETGGNGASAGAPWPLGERELRTQLSNMYAAMVASTDNARLLLDRDPADVRREDARGGDTARVQLAEACAWLDDVRIMCETPRAFDDAVLGCARSAAEYLVRVRGAGASTAHFDSWVFRKSSPQDAGGAGPGRTVISAVVPALEACMSVRAPPDMADAISRGFYRIGPATPMPLTNRLHSVSGAAAVPLRGGSPRLGEWDFLKASPSDLGALSGSLEMDAFCEIASVQEGLQQRLGAPVVLPGAVGNIDDYTVAIKGLAGEEVTAVRHGGSPPEPDGLPRGGSVRQAVGAHGRFLVAAWYHPGTRGAGAGGAQARYPELLHFEECGRDEAVLDDMIGYVRMRGRAVGAPDLGARYGEDYPSIAKRAARLLGGAEGAVSYARAAAGSPVRAAAGSPVREFFDAVGAMKAAWSRCRTGEGLPIAAADIASGERAGIGELALWMGRGGADRLNLLADIQHEFDRTGYRRGELGGGDGGGGMPRAAVSLVRQDLLRRDGSTLSVTDRGRKVLAAALRRDAERFVSGLDVLYLPEVKCRVPASVLLRHLRDSGSFERPEGPGGGRNSLLWTRKGAGAAAEAKRCHDVLAGQHRLVLECARTVNHVVNARFVRDELGRRGAHVQFLHASMMLEQLERAGRLEAAGDGSWSYPLRGRVLDTMRDDPARAWNLDDVLADTKAARKDAKDVRGALEGLAADGLLAGLEDKVWACRDEGSDERAQRRRRAAALARGAALSILRSRQSGMDSDRLVELVGGHLSVKFSRNTVRGLRQIARDAVSALVDGGKAVESGGIVRPAGP